MMINKGKTYSYLCQFIMKVEGLIGAKRYSIAQQHTIIHTKIHTKIRHEVYNTP